MTLRSDRPKSVTVVKLAEVGQTDATYIRREFAEVKTTSAPKRPLVAASTDSHRICSLGELVWLVKSICELNQVGFSQWRGRIGIGGSLAASPLPHLRAYGYVPRRFG